MFSLFWPIEWAINALRFQFLPFITAGIGSLLGTAASTALSLKNASDNRDFQRKMSDTSYVRAMQDMRNAGLNPILAAKIGGASTPSGAMASIPDFGQTLNTAYANQTARMQTEGNLEKIDAEITQILENTELTLHQQTKVKHEIANLAAEYDRIKATTEQTEAQTWFKKKAIEIMERAGLDEGAMGSILSLFGMMLGE